MRICRIGSTTIECSPLLLLVILFAFIAGIVEALLLNALALMLHELCHTLMANAIGYGVSSIELQPFGFVARLDKRINSRWDELAVAASGPLFSLIAGVGCIALSNLDFPLTETVARFGNINMMIALINLIPALPLDGGRMLESLLSELLSPRTAALICVALGIVFSIGMLAISVIGYISGNFNISLAVMGVFLLIGAVKEGRSMQSMRVDTMLRRSGSIRDGGYVGVRHLAINGDMSARNALRLVTAHRLTFFLVLNDRMGVIGKLSETELLDGIARNGGDIEVKHLMR